MTYMGTSNLRLCSSHPVDKFSFPIGQCTHPRPRFFWG